MKTNQQVSTYISRTGTALALAACLVAAAAYSQPSNVFDVGASSYVYALAVQPDGKILAGGAFIRLGGETRSRLGRINADGTLDASFNPAAVGTVNCIAVQPDGKILVGGAFTSLGKQTRRYLGRINADGTLDASFNPVVSGGTSPQVYCLLVQPDGKVLVGGSFTWLGGKTHNYIGRLNADGTVDTNFTAAANGVVYSLALQANDSIVVGGNFSRLNGQTHSFIGRLTMDGTLDTNFNAAANSYVHSLALQPDGGILAGGRFTKLEGQAHNYIGRLNGDGTLDTNFIAAASGYVYSLALQTDGRILAGGAFTMFNGLVRTNIARLNADGTLDGTFDRGANRAVYSLALQADGNILVGGSFTALYGQTRGRLARLHNTDPATESLAFDGTNLSWQRGGTSPEAWHVTFQYWTNGGGWTALGEGTRTAGGWELPGVSVPSDATIGARGYTVGGQYDGSSCFVESTIGPLAIFSQPASRTNNAGTCVTLSVYAGGVGPLAYQWIWNGTNLVDGGRVQGATSPSLTLCDLSAADGGSFSVVVNGAGTNITSVVATLAVVDPFIAQQPADTVGNRGEAVTLSVSVAGTLPLDYQWRKEGSDIAGATASLLTLTNVQSVDAGHYDVVASNVFGVVTSQVAAVTVNLALADAFNPGADGEGLSFAIQPDGKILVGGWFTMLGGQGCAYLGRLNADGTMDTNFNCRVDGGVDCLVLQADGKILTGGEFITLGGQICTNLGRLNGDGTIDTSFNAGADGWVRCLAVQADGKILVGGGFNTLSGQSCTNLGRLNADGTIDTNFNSGADDWVGSLAVQADGKILVGGGFNTLSGRSCANLGRLNADGTIDTNFNSGADDWVGSLAVQADGKVLVGGGFTILGGQSCANLGRLNADGTIDTNFNSVANGWVGSFALQADGKILVGGQFTTLSGLSCINLGRLNNDGTLDPGFHPITDENGWVNALGLQADGEVLVGGSLTMLAGQSRTNLGRLINTDPATQSLGSGGSAITWLRSGASPEVEWVTFDYSTNGVSWESLGAGTRVAGGWQLGGLTLPVYGSIRGRGQVSGGLDNGSSWFVESVIAAPAVSVVPASQTAGTGAAVSFSVVVLGGSPPLSYRWRKDGADIGGATNSSYAIAAMQGGDAGSYSVVVSNAYGSITSSPPAVLEWANPQVLITSGPADGARLVTSVLNLVGQASDNIALAAVEWQLNNSGTNWQSALGTTNWSATVTNLVVGSNTIRIRARDAAGYVSVEVPRSWVLLTPLTINISGCGTVTAGFSGTTFREAGVAYSVTATPCAGYAFSDWSGGASASTPTLNFVMRTGLVLNVTFVPEPYTPVKGTYTGLFYDTNGVAQESSGLFTLTVTTTRKPPGNQFSGNLRIGNSRLPFTGKFDNSGLANVTIKRRGLAAITTDLQVDTASGAALLVGSIGDMTWIAELGADRAMFNARANPATQFAGKYTMVIPGGGSAVEPQGNGSGAVSVSSGGTITLVGRLADGTAISQSAPLSMRGEWPLYIPLYSGKGSVLGWVLFGSRPAEDSRLADDLHGQLSWIMPAGGSRYYPAGFSNDAIMAVGERYAVPAKNHRIIEVADGLVAFSGGALAGPFANTVTISAANQVKNTSTNKLSLSFTTSSGLYSGSVTVPGTRKSFSFNGAVLQGRSSGSGYFLYGNRSGQVILEPR